MLVPKIDICYASGAFIPSDVTGVYDAEDNTGGYETPNDAGSDVTSAIITVTYPDGTSSEFDVTPQIPDTVTGDIEFTELDITIQDGIYQVDYEVIADGTTYTHCIKKAFFTLVSCCIEKLILGIVNKSIHDGEDLIYIHSVIEADALLTGLRAAALTISTQEINNILATLNRICDYYDGTYGCGCS